MLFTDKTPYLGSTALSSAYIGAQKVWPGRDPAFAGWEAVFDLYQPHNPGTAIAVNRKLGTEKVTVPTPSSVSAQITAVCVGYFGSIVLAQDGREAIYVNVAGSTITLRSTGDRGKYPIEFTAPYPYGIGTSEFHLVQVSTYKDWYGYRVKLLIDGDEVGTQTNGGAFNLSENLTPGSTAELSVSGNFAAFGWKSQSLINNDQTSAPETKARMQPGYVCWATYQSSGLVNSFIPAADAQAWLVAGGDGGQGGAPSRWEKDSSDGASGSSGETVALPWFVEGYSLSGGAGGAGGAVGSAGAPGSNTLYGPYSTFGSTARQSSFTAWGSSFINPLGKGGSGGSGAYTETYSDGDSTYHGPTSGSSGGAGGLVVARRWSSKGMVVAIPNDTNVSTSGADANGLPGRWKISEMTGDASLVRLRNPNTFLEVMADVTCDRDVRSRAGTIISKGTVLSRGTLIAAAESAVGTQQFVFTGV